MSLTGKFRVPYYVVIHGSKPGIYRSKAKFEKAIENYPTAIYGVLPTQEKAEKFIKNFTPEKTIIQEFKDFNKRGIKHPWAKVYEKKYAQKESQRDDIFWDGTGEEPENLNQFGTFAGIETLTGRDKTASELKSNLTVTGIRKPRDQS